ncbi:Transposase and inactivated derivatives [Amycolatopsis marina]|uniref:Transposase and inactivated derivatives n=2 Tax=Amycolatopsis marina TaxID=490629 RepID=A0A1I1CAB7_9PSEU|nr:Transposase and inactivated derivatives [Amycolatopsis marina]SFB59875.1 Transposase and inactivated derivatives [Amycolatopsis marina]
MEPRSSLSEVQREAAVVWFEQGLADRTVSTLLGVARWPVRSLYRRWRIHGRAALVSMSTKRSFSFEFKLSVVERFVAGEPAAELAAEHGLSSPSLVKTWARTYRREGEDGLRPKRKGRPPKPPDSPGEQPSELEQLRRENDRLRAEVAYLGKLRALRGQQRR